jgi:hypothetical protein
MMKISQLAPAARINMCLVRQMEREWDATIRAEEAAETEAVAWRRAKASERALRRLQAARAGLPLPVAAAPRTARNLARAGFAALASIGRAVARALATQAALRKAQAVSAARKVARLVRQSLRRTLRAVAVRALVLVPVTTKKEIVVMKAPKLAARITVTRNFGHSGVAVDGRALGFFDMDGPESMPERFRLGCWLVDSYFVFKGGPFGEHSIAADETITSAERLLAHWQGYCDNTVRAFAARAHHAACRRAGLAVAQRALALAGAAS